MKVGDKVMHRKDPTIRGSISEVLSDGVRITIWMGREYVTGYKYNWEVIDNEVRDPQCNQLGRG